MSVQPNTTTAGHIRSHALFRSLNEQIERISDGFEVEDRLELVCECEHGECFERFSVTRAAYEAVRRFPTRFLLKPEHAGAGDRVVEAADGYAVIETTGAGAEQAIKLDPRRSGRSGPTP